MEKLSDIKDIKVFNDAFLDFVKQGNTKEAQVSAQTYTRNKLREDSFCEKILTPIDISNDELDKSEDPELLVKWNDREPDAAPAVSVPLGVVPDGLQFTGTRYPSYFSRIMSPMFRKDVDKLRGFDYDIRQIMLEISTKDIATEVDTKFMDKINSVIGTANTNNPLNAVSLPQWVTTSDPITRTSFIDATKVMLKLKVPFGPMQPDGQDAKGVILCNNITAMEFVKFQRGEVGGDKSQDSYISGKPPETICGFKMIYTIKRDLIPDNSMYFFSSEEFLGKYYRLQPLTVWMKSEAFFLQWFQYLNISMSIGNVRGAVRYDFAA